MLGFSPLASAPLGDDGEVDVVVPVILDVPSADVGISAVAPTISIGASVAVPAAATSIAAVAPRIATGAAAFVPAVNTSIAALEPTVSSGVLVQVGAVVISIGGIAPGVGPASGRRAVHVSAASNNLAVLTHGPNACIVLANTPNSVVVQKSNEAA